MIGFLTGRAAVEGAFKLSRGLLLGLVFAGLFAAGGLGFWRGMVAIERMVKTASTQATQAANDRCDAAREASNALAQSERAREAIAAAEASSRAEATIADLTKSLTEWESRNAKRADAGQSCLGPDDLAELERLRNRGR
ncbi:MAG: hypothetical protein ACRDBL_09130 [Rhabdaerophilum sp.]